MLLLRDSCWFTLLLYLYCTLYTTTASWKTFGGDKSFMPVGFRGGNQYMSDDLAGCFSLFYQFKKVKLTFALIV